MSQSDVDGSSVAATTEIGGPPVPVEEPEGGAAPSVASSTGSISEDTDAPDSPADDASFQDPFPGETDVASRTEEPSPPLIEPSGPDADELVDEVYAAVRRTFGSEITLENVASLVTEVMEAVNTVKDAPGPKKKRIATAVINKLLAEASDDVVTPEVTAVIRLILPNLIDSIISAFKHQVDLSSIEKKTRKFLWCC